LGIFTAREYVNSLAPGNLLASCFYYDCHCWILNIYCKT